MEKRKYTLRKRAEGQEDTRARIVEATMQLHEELGPRNTTFSSVAERAGVQRLTVYRYFPDEMALFQACTSCWLESHPPPPLPAGDLRPAAAQAALLALYQYYRDTQKMWVVSYRDVDLVPALQGPMRGVAQYQGAYASALITRWSLKSKQEPLRAAATVAVQFATWQTLDGLGLKDEA
ncbi:MAG: TetR/AcrR family transcriptional regulator, partial [Candidatus Methylophosphatis roskildensis]